MLTIQQGDRLLHVVSGLVPEPLGFTEKVHFLHRQGRLQTITQGSLQQMFLNDFPDLARLEPLRGWHDHRADGQVELQSEHEVAFVVSGHRHDGARPVTDEHIVGNPDRNLFAVDRIDGKGAGKDAGLLLGQLGAFQIAFLGGLGLVFPQQRMLGSEYHIGGAKQRVRPGREYPYLGVW